MYLFLLFIIVCAYFLCTDAYEITSSDVIIHVSDQHDAIVLASQQESREIWQNATRALELANNASDVAIQSAAMLYDSAGATLLLSKMEPACTVGPFSQYQSDFELVYSTICCHLRKIRTPALQLLASRAYTLFHGGGNEEIDSSTNNVLRSLMELGRLDTGARKISTCFNDARLYASEYQTVRALVAIYLAGKIERQYHELTTAFESIQTCITVPAAGCARNTTLLWEDASINVDFALYDETFLNACDIVIPAETCLPITEL
jgi:hypothetical protein